MRSLGHFGGGAWGAKVVVGEVVSDGVASAFVWVFWGGEVAGGGGGVPHGGGGHVVGCCVC